MTWHIDGLVQDRGNSSALTHWVTAVPHQAFDITIGTTNKHTRGEPRSAVILIYWQQADSINHMINMQMMTSYSYIFAPEERKFSVDKCLFRLVLCYCSLIQQVPSILLNSTSWIDDWYENCIYYLIWFEQRLSIDSQVGPFWNPRQYWVLQMQ